MKKKKLHYFVLFSGGLDSTFLVWKLLKAGHKITTFYVSILNNDIKTKIEKAHRTLLLEKFKNEFGHDKIVDSYGDYEIRLHSFNHERYGTVQPQLWVSAAALSCPNDVDRVAIGYVMGDSILSYVEDLKKLYNAHNHMIRDDKLPKLEFPLTKYFKQEFVNLMPSEYVHLTYYCENPRYFEDTDKGIVYSSCGNCGPCKTAKREYHLNTERYLINSKGKTLMDSVDLEKASDPSLRMEKSVDLSTLAKKINKVPATFVDDEEPIELIDSVDLREAGS